LKSSRFSLKNDVASLVQQNYSQLADVKISPQKGHQVKSQLYKCRYPGGAAAQETSKASHNIPPSSLAMFSNRKSRDNLLGVGVGQARDAASRGPYKEASSQNLSKAMLTAASSNMHASSDKDPLPAPSDPKRFSDNLTHAKGANCGHSIGL